MRRGGDVASGVPGPASPGHPTPSMPASLFPTTVKWGDVVTVQGNFAGKFQGQVVVRFAGVPAQAIAMMSPYGGSVVVPEGAQTGACQVEVDGRVVFGANCVISKGLSGGPLPAQAPEHAAVRAWKNYGPSTALLGTGGDMPYFADSYQGAGAIAASAPAPRSAPAPTVGRIAGSPTAGVIRGIPTIARPSSGVRRIYPGVTTRKYGPTRAPVILSGRQTAAQVGLAPRRPVLTIAPPLRQPSVQIGSGIGTPRRDVLAPADDAWSRYKARQAGVALTRTEAGYAQKGASMFTGGRIEIPTYEAEPIPGEEGETAEEIMARLEASKPMSRRTKLILGGLAAAALGYYFLVVRR
jgi:hypothetical protein